MYRTTHLYIWNYEENAKMETKKGDDFSFFLLLFIFHA